MVFEGRSIKDMLILYSTLVGKSTSPDETSRLFKDLEDAVMKVDTSFCAKLGTSLTSCEALLLVEKELTFDADDEGYLDNTFAEHKLILKKTEELAVRKYIYDSIGKKGEFVVYFEDLKFSAPMCLVHGEGYIVFNNTIITFEVKDKFTILYSDNQKALVDIVVAAVDALYEQ